MQIITLPFTVPKLFSMDCCHYSFFRILLKFKASSHKQILSNVFILELINNDAKKSDITKFVFRLCRISTKSSFCIHTGIRFLAYLLFIHRFVLPCFSSLQRHFSLFSTMGRITDRFLYFVRSSYFQIQLNSKQIAIDSVTLLGSFVVVEEIKSLHLILFY